MLLLARSLDHIRVERLVASSRLLLAGRPDNQPDTAKSGQASLDQLIHVEKILSEYAPRFFTDVHPLSIYTQNLVFVNNLRGLKTEGLQRYLTQLMIYRMYYTVRYLRSRVEVLNLVKHPEESFIKLRWRVVSDHRVLGTTLMTYQVRPKKERWKDGLSTFYVNSDGKIYYHICDNVDADITHHLVSQQGPIHVTSTFRS